MKNICLLTFIVLLVVSCGAESDIYFNADTTDLEQQLRDHEERLKRLENVVLELDTLDTMQVNLDALEANLNVRFSPT